jgi:hypothetical protein
MNSLNQIHPGKQVSVYSSPHEKELERMLVNNRNIQQFNNLSFGSVDVLLDLPYRHKLVDGFYIKMTLPQPCTYGPAIAYRLISQIRYNVNGSTIYQQEGVQVMLRALDQCESKEKRDALIFAAGGSAATTAITANTSVMAFIPLPFSHLRCGNTRKWFDINGAGGNLKIYVSLRQKSECFTVEPAANALVSASFRWREAQFVNMASYMKFDGGKYYRYPFSNWQSRTLTFTGVQAGSGLVNVTLNGFRNAMCKSIYVGVIETSDLSTNKNQVAFQEITNIKLELNGETLFRTDDNEYRLSHLFHTSVPDEIQQPNGTNRQYYNLQISSENSKSDQSKASNSGRNFSSQDLILNFNTSTTNAYTLFLCYVYNALIVEDGLNAQIFL